MTVSDFSKFYDFLISGGKSSKENGGKQLLSAHSVRRLTHGVLSGLDRSSPLASLMGLSDHNQNFNYGWAKVAATPTTPHCNFWSGYANNHGRLYVEQGAYLLVFPQFMGSSKGGWLLGTNTVRNPATQAFLSTWRQLVGHNQALGGGSEGSEGIPKAGKCPFPFILLHDPIEGMKNPKFWICLVLLLALFYR